jgi:putative flavoprotein involved in K+ transport
MKTETGAHAEASIVGKPVQSLLKEASAWLAAFEQSLARHDHCTLAELFQSDSHWRDLLALTWDVRTVSGGDAIAAALIEASARLEPSNLRIDPDRTLPREVRRAGESVLEVLFRFDTTVGPCDGVLRLRQEADGAPRRAWSLATSLDAIRGHEEQFRKPRNRSHTVPRSFQGPNWLDMRQLDAAYEDRDPTVLVIGGGQAGLSVAARFRQLGIDALVIDRHERAGDNWRKRYHSLTLHNRTSFNHLPYLPFPDTWPDYIPKDMLATWFEHYVVAMEINLWSATEFVSGRYDESVSRWTVTVRRADGSERVLKPRHLVMATGVSSIPAKARIAGLDAFKGAVLHSSEYTFGAQWSGRPVMVFGTGTSAHDVAQDLEAHGAKVTIVQRSPTMVQNVEPTAQLPYKMYEEGPSVDDCDLISAGMPLALVKRASAVSNPMALEIDRPMIDGLKAAGFQVDEGLDGIGWTLKYQMRGGGYYFNVGCSNLIAEGKIRILQFADIEAFEPSGVKLRDGSSRPADLIVTATGYLGQREMAAKLLGDDVAARIGPVWGINETSQELNNMWCRTPQPGLWFLGGGLAQCRMYSKTLALQIQAVELGLLSGRLPTP